MRRAVAIVLYGCILFFVISAIIGLIWALMLYVLIFIGLVIFGGVVFLYEPEEEPDDWKP